MSAPPSQPDVLILGAGTMGRGIARLLLHSGHRVVLTDRDPRALSAAAAEAAHCGDGATLTTTSDWQHEGHLVDLVIECVSESAQVKAEVLAELSAVVTPSCVIASNTSSFTPTELAEHTTGSERLLCLHFFNPPDLVRLVEIQGHAGTSPHLLDWARGWVAAIGSHPVLVSAERRGFVANRLQAALLVEAVALVNDGVVTAEELDDIVTTSIGPRWAAVGPLTVADLGGLDVFAALVRRIGPTLASADTTAALLEERVAQGRTGVKAAAGFHTYAQGADHARDRIARLVRLCAQ